MSKALIVALLLLALAVLVLIFNASGRVDIVLVPGWWTVHALRALAFLGFLGIGVIIGILLK